MAIYYNLCVDCGAEESLADSIAEHFDGFNIKLDDRVPVRCKILRSSERGIEFAGVEPIGMGYGTLPASDRRPDLIDDSVVLSVRQAFYNELKQFHGFRRAMFGAECWDQLVCATADEDSDIDFGWMISSTKYFPIDPDNCNAELYNDGYRIVVKPKNAT